MLVPCYSLKYHGTVREYANSSTMILPSSANTEYTGSASSTRIWARYCGVLQPESVKCLHVMQDPAKVHSLNEVVLIEMSRYGLVSLSSGL